MCWWSSQDQDFWFMILWIKSIFVPASEFLHIFKKMSLCECWVSIIVLQMFFFCGFHSNYFCRLCVVLIMSKCSALSGDGGNDLNLSFIMNLYLFNIRNILFLYRNRSRSFLIPSKNSSLKYDYFCFLVLLSVYFFYLAFCFFYLPF